jgi:CBS domain containing-hemolysin-like protein
LERRRAPSGNWKNVTDLQLFSLASLGAVLIFDLILSAARSALDDATLPRLLAQRDSHESGVPIAIQIISASTYPRAALHVAQVLARFLLAGLLLLSLPKPITADWWWGIAALAIGSLPLAWMEWIVEERVASHPEGWSVRLAPFIQALAFVLTPVLALTLGLFSIRKNTEPGPTSVTQDELKILVDASQQEGVLEQEEREMIYSIFRLGDTLVREIMVPRIDITALDVQTAIPAAIDSLLESGYSRVPVYEETVDNVQGLLYTKDLLKLWREGSQDRTLGDLLRPAYFVPEAKKVDELLAEMQTQRIHMALIVDEYGGIAGLVTLEDIVEEIVGEIQDEYDQAEESPYQQVGESEYIFQGRVGLDEINEVMGTNLPGEEAETLGGFIYFRIGRVPVPQEVVQVDDVIFSVEQVIGRRIRKVRARRLPASSNNPEAPVKADSHDNGPAAR